MATARLRAFDTQAWCQRSGVRRDNSAGLSMRCSPPCGSRGGGDNSQPRITCRAKQIIKIQCLFRRSFAASIGRSLLGEPPEMSASASQRRMRQPQRCSLSRRSLRSSQQRWLCGQLHGERRARFARPETEAAWKHRSLVLQAPAPLAPSLLLLHLSPPYRRHRTPSLGTLRTGHTERKGLPPPAPDTVSPMSHLHRSLSGSGPTGKMRKRGCQIDSRAGP